MKLNLHKSFLMLCVVALSVVSCKKEYQSVKELDEQNIQAYIRQNNLTVYPYDTTGIYYQVIKEGDGAPIEYNENIPLFFTVKSLDNAFSSQDTFTNRYAGLFGYFSRQYQGNSGILSGRYIPYRANEVIKQFVKNQGGQIRLIVPSRLALGRNGANGVPENASLDYVVTVLKKADLQAYEDQSINKYMQANNLTGFTKHESGVYYKIDAAGTGSPITVDSTLTVKYTGKLLNGQVFDGATSASFKLNGLIPAWQKVVPLIKEGGKVRLITPSTQGYGLQGSGAAIPPFSSLDFDIEVTEVSK